MRKIIILFLFILIFPSLSFAQERGPEDVVIEYFDRLYSAYLANDPIDISDLLDMSSPLGGFARDFKLLIERRSYIEIMGYAYVETQRFPLELEIEEVDIQGDFAEVSFLLKIDPNRAYPTFIYPGRNFFYLNKYEDGWKISERNHRDIDLSGPGWFSDYEKPELSYEKEVRLLRRSIDWEFAQKKQANRNFLFPAFGLKADPQLYGLGRDDYIYDPGRAIQYIDYHIYNRNDRYADLQENCANFTSQIIYYGFFGEEYPYIGAWNNFDGDYTENWVYVGLLMEYMTYPRMGDHIGPRSSIARTVYDIALGGVIEVKAVARQSYAHTMQLWDYQKMIFSGNNFDGYRYYSDLMGYKRFYQPLFFRL